jgi:hypothetical protein
LLQRVGTTSGGREQLDQAAMGRLVQLVQREALTRPRDRLIHPSGAGERIPQPVEQRRALAPHLVLDIAQPVIELDAVAQREAGQHVVAVQLARKPERAEVGIRIGLDRTRLGEIEPRPVEHQRDRAAVRAQPILTERRAKRRQRPPQRRAAPRAVELGPQQVGHDSTAVCAVGHRQESQHRDRLARVDRKRPAVDLDQRRPKQRDPKWLHATSIPRKRNGFVTGGGLRNDLGTGRA